MGSKFLLLFLDGVGIGPDHEEANPFVLARTPYLTNLIGGKLTGTLLERRCQRVLFARLDATLGFDGLPQSATGQTSLIAGINGAEVMSGHYGPWPGPTLKSALDKGTLFSRANCFRGGANLANAYPPSYFKALERRRFRVNVPVYAALASGGKLASINELVDREAVRGDITREALRKTVPNLNPLSPGEAGNDLAKMSRKHTFTFFDFWMTDRVGHRGSFQEALDIVEKVDKVIGGVLEELGPNTTLIISSDHGNIEEMNTSLHTRNPVPLIVYGPEAERFRNAKTLTDVPKIIYKVWGYPG